MSLSNEFWFQRLIWEVLLLLSIICIPSQSLGDVRVALNNYDADCPIIDQNQLAAEGAYIEALIQLNGSPFMPLVFDTNGNSRISMKEPGYFDAGVVSIEDLLRSLGGGSVANFQVRAWDGGPTYQSANLLKSAIWTQPLNIPAEGTNEPEPLKLNIPYEWIWIVCWDCEQVYAAARGHGKVEIDMPPPGPPEFPGLPDTHWGVVTLRAVADPGYYFVNWKGNGWDFQGHSETYYANSSTFWFNYSKGAAQFLATFAPACHLHVNVPFGGWVTNNPPGIDYAPGTQVTLTATAKPNFKFSGWTGDITGTNPVAMVTLNSNLTVTANFQTLVTPLLVLPPASSGGGMSTNGFGFLLLGELGGKYTVESSHDLRDWRPFTHIIATNSIVPLLSPFPTNDTPQYFRAHAD